MATCIHKQEDGKCLLKGKHNRCLRNRLYCNIGYYKEEDYEKMCKHYKPEMVCTRDMISPLTHFKNAFGL